MSVEFKQFFNSKFTTHSDICLGYDVEIRFVAPKGKRSHKVEPLRISAKELV
ncbi:MAG: hypothetical protein RMY16_08760 [Nostoc sp. DedQUE12b]|uniref:hypothetical protein n=1 Tax=Nostoc sp. DedQUE12b TaxID=3075398 RepID=UPI002AD2A2BC|nr:hypothetical protein [Nostoc sp. DedQUE12b]MDZ8085670.1 hypothetical protein [Nostoc sp. DedQUE12b]